MSSPTGPRVRQRLRSLALLELVNIPLQAMIWFWAIGLPVTLPNLVGYVLVGLLLLQGAGYWIAKLGQIAGKRPQLPAAGFFGFARLANPVVLAAGVGFTGWAVATDPGAVSWPGLCFALFAVLEYINYFRTQLMYDNAADLRLFRAHGLRRAHLARDLDRARGANAS